MLRYTLVSADDEDLLNHVLNILNSCGLQMFKDYGLEHWIPAYSLASIKKDCEDNFVFLVFDTMRCEYVSTFQICKSNIDSLYIRKVATHPDYYGRGIGGRNLRFVESFVQKMKCSAIELDVYDKSEQAIRFYLSNGFLVTGRKATRRFKVLLMRKEI